MTEKELKKLRKADMLRIMLEQRHQIDRLTRELDTVKEQLRSREISIERVGSIADASLAVNGIFEDAQKAAVDYLKNVQKLAEKQYNRSLPDIGLPDFSQNEEGDGYGEDGEEEDGEETKKRPPSDKDPPEQKKKTKRSGRMDLPTVEQLEHVLSRRKTKKNPYLALTKQPTAQQIEQYLSEWQYRRRYFWTVRSTISALITVSAIAVLIASLLLPVLRIYGSSMNPTLIEDDFVVSLKSNSMKTGDIVAFYYNNKVLVKRVIAQAGQWVDIDKDGTVYVDNEKLDEPYLQDKALGECDIKLPYQVPESRVFVMGDNRSVSVDSRSTTVGCVAEEQLVGKIVFCIWPINEFGNIN